MPTTRSAIRYVIGSLFVVLLVSAAWGQCERDSMYPIKLFPQFPLQYVKGRIIAGRILCLSTEYCSVAFPSQEPGYWIVDVGRLSFDERASLATVCTAPQTWGCTARFTLEHQQLGVFNLTWLEWDRPSVKP